MDGIHLAESFAELNPFGDASFTSTLSNNVDIDTLVVASNHPGSVDVTATTLLTSVEPDAFPDATNISTAYPGVTLSDSDIFGDMQVYSRTYADASTGSRVFGHHEGVLLQGAANILDIEFASPTSDVRIDVIGSQTVSRGGLQLLDASGASIGVLNTGPLAAGQVETLSFSSPTANIARARVYDIETGTPAVVADNLWYGSGNGIDPLLTLWDRSNGAFLEIYYDTLGKDPRITRSLSPDKLYQFEVTSETELSATAGYTISINGPNQLVVSLPVNAGGVGTTTDSASLNTADYFAVVAPVNSGATADFRITNLTTLDGVLTLYDGAGNALVRRNSGGAGVSETISYNGITPGATYYLRVAGLNYATSGAYQLTVDFNVPPPVIGTLRGTQFDDTDSDGFQDAGEAGLSDWRIYLDQNSNGVYDVGEPTDLTDANGDYEITGLPAGTYNVAAQHQPTWLPTGPDMNNSFENNELLGWGSAGYAVVQSAVSGVTPAEGAYHAFLSTQSGAVSDSALEAFASYNSGTLDSFAGANVVEGSALRKIINSQVGTQLSFDWNFLTNQATPSTNNDFAFLSILPVGLGSPNLELADTNSMFVNSPHVFFAEETGWQSFDLTFSLAGQWIVTLGVVDVGSASTDSALLVDNLQVTPPTGSPPPGQHRVTLVSSAQIVSNLDFGAIPIEPASLAGSFYHDVDGDGTRQPGEPGMSNARVFIDNDGDGVFDQGSTVEPDRYAAGSVINGVNPAVELEAVSTTSTIDSTVLAVSSSFSTTAPHVFASTLSNVWTSSRLLRANFAAPQAFVSIDYISDDAIDVGELRAYDAADQLVGVYTTGNLNSGQSESMVIHRPVADIAYVTAGSASPEAGFLDHLRFGTEPWLWADSNGNYSFQNLLPGDYRLAAELPAGWRQTAPTTFGLQITEIDFDTPDFLEIQNLSGAELDTSGWIVAVSNNTSSINSVDPQFLAMPDSLAPGEVLDRTDQSGLNYWGNNINWAANGGGWVMILDSFGRIVDWLGWGWTPAELASFNLTIGGHTVDGLGDAWSGDAAPNSGAASLQRQGAEETNTAADFAYVSPQSRGLHNVGLTSPVQTVTLQAGDAQNRTFGAQPIPATILGTVFADLDGSGNQEAGELGLADRTVYADYNQNGLLDPGAQLEPDDYGLGTVLNTIHPEVVLTALSSGNGNVTSASGAFASTGTRIFGHPTGTSWSGVGARLRIDVPDGATSMSIDFIADSGGDIGVLSAYNGSGVLLATYVTASLAAGQSETMTISRPTGDIAYAIASGQILPGLLDNLRTSGEPFALTDAVGDFQLFGVKPEPVEVRQVLPAQAWQTTPTPAHALNPHAASIYSGVTFGSQPNVAPIAHAGGPYAPLAVGSDWSPSAAASTDANLPFGDILSYAWDLDSDGQYDDATGVNPTIPWSQLATLLDYPADPQTGLPTNLVRVRVTDSFGLIGQALNTLSVYLNEPYASFTGPASPVEAYQTVTFDGSGSLHGFPGRSIVAYEWDFDYDGVTFNVEATGPIVMRSFNLAGARTVALRVRDDNAPAKEDLATSTLQVIDSFAPRVVAVKVGAANGGHSEYLVPSGSGEQWRTVPVGGADTVSLQFSEDLELGSISLRLYDSANVQLPSNEFGYDPMTFTASWRFPALTDDRWRIVLGATTADLSGNVVDGEWDNPTSLADTKSSSFPSGDGAAGGQFIFTFTILPGDANRDNQVTGADYTIWADHFGASGAAFTDGDFTGDDQVTGADYTVWADNYNQVLTLVEDGPHDDPAPRPRDRRVVAIDRVWSEAETEWLAYLAWRNLATDLESKIIPSSGIRETV